MAEYIIYLGAALIFRGISAWESSKDHDEDRKQRSLKGKLWDFAVGNNNSNKEAKTRYSLVPPVFTREFDRNSLAKSPLQQIHLTRNALFNDYFTENELIHCNFHMSPEQSSQHDIQTEISVPRYNHGNDNINSSVRPEAKAIFRIQPTQNKYSFTEFMINTEKGGFANAITAFEVWRHNELNNTNNINTHTLIANTNGMNNLTPNNNKDNKTNIASATQTASSPSTPLVDAIVEPVPINSLSVSVFAKAPLFTGNALLNPTASKDSSVGLRMDDSTRSIGLHVNPLDNEKNTIGGWLAVNQPNIRGGVEWNYSVTEKKAPIANYSLFYTPNRTNNHLDPNYEVGLQINNVPMSNEAAATIMLGRNNTANSTSEGQVNISGNNNPIELIASYYHHMVVRRRVTNPFEKKEVIGIHNYIDLGFESVHKQNTNPSLRFAAAWQLNKNSLLKFKVSEQQMSAMYAYKNWWSPSALISVTGTRHFTGNNKTFIGINFSVENFGSVLFGQTDNKYRRTVANIKQQVTNKQLEEDPDF